MRLNSNGTPSAKPYLRLLAAVLLYAFAVGVIGAVQPASAAPRLLALEMTAPAQVIDVGFKKKIIGHRFGRSGFVKKGFVHPGFGKKVFVRRGFGHPKFFVKKFGHGKFVKKKF